MPRSDYTLGEIDGLIGLLVEAALAEIEGEMRAAGTVAGIPAPARTDDGERITTEAKPEA